MTHRSNVLVRPLDMTTLCVSFSLGACKYDGDSWLNFGFGCAVHSFTMVPGQTSFCENNILD